MGNNEIDEDVMPVFLINGFLEAGKTQFLEFTMDQEYFQTEGKTLLIVCEEGDTEYDEKKLKKHQTAVVYVDELSKLTPVYNDQFGITKHSAKERLHILDVQIKGRTIDNGDLLVNVPVIRQFQLVLVPHTVPL